MATLKDVARRAGVSASTVSYVFNGKKTVRADTAKRIFDAIEETGYHPDFAARSLKTSQTRSVGIVVADFSNIFYIDVLSGIESRLARDGYSSIVCNSRNSAQTEFDNLRSLVYRSIDGIILLGTGRDTSKATAELTVPVVSVDRVTHDSSNTVAVDNVMGGYLGTRHLLDKGLRNITFVGFNQQLSSQDRRQGCLNAYAEAGIPAAGHFRYVETNVSPEDGYRLAKQIAGDGRRGLPHAIFVGTDYVAFGLLKALSDLGLSVPEDVAVIGYDDLLLSQFTRPALTTIRQPSNLMGDHAADMLLHLLTKEPCQRRVLLEPSLILRDST